MGTKEIFRANLPYYMKRAGMNQIELAQAVGKSEASVSLWLSGKVFPRIDTIQKIAEVLGCQSEDLLMNETRQNHSVMNLFVTAPQSFDPSLVTALEERTRPQTPQEDAKMAVLWRKASIQAKRAAIAVLEAMKEENLK